MHKNKQNGARCRADVAPFLPLPSPPPPQRTCRSLFRIETAARQKERCLGRAIAGIEGGGEQRSLRTSKLTLAAHAALAHRPQLALAEDTGAVQHQTTAVLSRMLDHVSTPPVGIAARDRPVLGPHTITVSGNGSHARTVVTIVVVSSAAGSLGRIV